VFPTFPRIPATFLPAPAPTLVPQASNDADVTNSMLFLQHFLYLSSI